MQVVLPLVAELHSEFMRDRHWKQLMTIAGQTFAKGNTQVSFNYILHKWVNTRYATRLMWLKIQKAN